MFLTQYKWLNKRVEVKHQSFTQKAYDKINKKIVNVKCMFHDSDKSINEIRHLKKLYFHPYCIKMHNFFFLTTNIVFIVTENYNFTLHSFLKTNGCLSEQNCHKILKQIVYALYFLTKYKILYRNLTDSNIIVCAKTLRIKFKDFNMTKKLKKNIFHKKQMFKTLFAPPEWFFKKKFTTDKLATWFLGLIFYKMLYNKLPFKSSYQIMFFPCICIRKKISLSCFALLKWCLTKNPLHRITLKEITCHPWITKKWI